MDYVNYKKTEIRIKMPIRISFELLNFRFDLGNKCTYILDEFKYKFFLSYSTIIEFDVYLTFNFFYVLAEYR